MLRSAARLLTQGQRLASAARPFVSILSGTHSGTQAPQVRTFAEAALQEPSVEIHGVHGRYAMALFHAAVKKGDLNKIDKDLEEIQALARSDKVFAQFLADPSVPKKEKMAALNEILSKIQVSETTQALFELLAENNRLKEVPKITETFLDIVASARGQVKALITTAQRLSGKELGDLKKGLEGILKPGQTLLVDQQVEPAIIGGIIIDVGDKHIDLSILTRVKKIQQLLLETV